MTFNNNETKTRQNSESYVTLLRKNRSSNKNNQNNRKSEDEHWNGKNTPHAERRRSTTPVHMALGPFYYALETKMTILHEKEK